MELLSGNPFTASLESRGLAVLDGGLATALETLGRSLADELWSARLLRDDPDAIEGVHLQYLKAGTDCITTASYQASYEGLAAAGMDRAEATALLLRSTALARKAVEAYESGDRPRTLVAASIGPYAAFLADGSEYTGRYEAGRSKIDSFHRDRWDVLAGTGPDLMACETIPNGVEARVLMQILADDDRFWAWFSFCCGDGGGCAAAATPEVQRVRPCLFHLVSVVCGMDRVRNAAR